MLNIAIKENKRSEKDWAEPDSGKVIVYQHRYGSSTGTYRLPYEGLTELVKKITLYGHALEGK